MISKFSVRDNEKLIFKILKLYPHMTKIIIYHNSYKIYFGFEKNRDDSVETKVSKISQKINDNRSLRRTKTLVLLINSLYLILVKGIYYFSRKSIIYFRIKIFLCSIKFMKYFFEVISSYKS